MPSIVFAARSFIAAVLARERPAAADLVQQVLDLAQVGIDLAAQCVEVRRCRLCVRGNRLCVGQNRVHLAQCAAHVAELDPTRAAGFESPWERGLHLEQRNRRAKLAADLIALGVPVPNAAEYLE